MANGSSGWVVGRYIWDSIIGLAGVAMIVVGAVDVWHNRKASNPLIVLGVFTILCALYMMFRRIPRFTGGGEEERSATAENIDTGVIIGGGILALIGCVIAGTVGA